MENLLIFVVLAAVCWALLSDRGEGFQEKSKLYVTNYNASWCPYSRQLQPTWTALMQGYASHPHVQLVDKQCSSPQDIQKARIAGVTGFPTLIIESKGIREQYRGDLTHDAIRKAIESKLSSMRA